MAIKLAVSHKAMTMDHELHWRGGPVNGSESRVARREKLKDIGWIEMFGMGQLKGFAYFEFFFPVRIMAALSPLAALSLHCMIIRE